MHPVAADADNGRLKFASIPATQIDSSDFHHGRSLKPFLGSFDVDIVSIHIEIHRK